MPLLIAAVIVLTALVVVDLVLSGAIIRRLRETEARLDEMTGGSAPVPSWLVAPRAPCRGRLRQSDLLGTSTIIGFFSTGCRYCAPQAEALLQKSEILEQDGVRVISVLALSEDQEDELTPTLDKAGRLVTQPWPGSLKETFGVFADPDVPAVRRRRDPHGTREHPRRRARAVTRLVPSVWGSTARLFGMALALYFRSARLAACLSVVVMVVNGVVPIATAWFTAKLIDGLGGAARRRCARGSSAWRRSGWRSRSSRTRRASSSRRSPGASRCSPTLSSSPRSPPRRAWPSSRTAGTTTGCGWRATRASSRRRSWSARCSPRVVRHHARRVRRGAVLLVAGHRDAW